jgi:HEAT repeat protein
LSEWLQEYDTKAVDLKPEAKNAIRQMGTNSIPELLRMLRSESSGNTPWRVTCAFRALGQEAKTAVPALIEILQSSAPVEMRVQAAASLGFVGPDAQAAIPSLIAALGDKENIPMRMNSIGALTRIGGDPSVLVPVFTASLDDPFWDVRIWAATGLSKFGSQAESAVPKLMEALSNTDEEAKVLVALRKALETIDPAAAGKAQVK